MFGAANASKRSNATIFICAEANEWPRQCRAPRVGRPGLLPLVDRHDLFADRFAHVFAERTVKAIVLKLFEDLGAPAGAAGNRENRSEQIRRNAERVVN